MSMFRDTIVENMVKEGVWPFEKKDDGTKQLDPTKKIVKGIQGVSDIAGFVTGSPSAGSVGRLAKRHVKHLADRGAQAVGLKKKKVTPVYDKETQPEKYYAQKGKQTLKRLVKRQVGRVVKDDLKRGASAAVDRLREENAQRQEEHPD